MDDTNARVAELKQMVARFCEERDWDQFHNAKDLAIGIVTEASELLESFRFKSDGEVDLMFKDKLQSKSIRDELADIVYFTVRLAQRYAIDISSSLEEKIKESARKYPVEKAKGSNKKYTEFAP